MRVARTAAGTPLDDAVRNGHKDIIAYLESVGAKKGAAPAKGGKKQLPPVEAKPQVTQTEDILNSILPPR